MSKWTSERSRLHETHCGATKPYKLHTKINLGALGALVNYMPKWTSERSRLHETPCGATKPYKLHAKMDLGALGATKPY